jgi:hypothetical protein
LSLLLFFLPMSLSQSCLSVSLEGGGSHGAYEAGALYTMAYTLPAASVAYDIISGISAGAINTGAMVQFPKGQEQAMATFMVNTWLTIGGNSSVYVQWPGGVLFEPGVYDTSPLRQFLTSRLTKGIQRPFTVGTTSLDTGTFVNFDETIGSQNLVEAIMCSGSPPFIFPYQNFQGNTFADGGCLINLDVFQAISRCYAKTNNYAAITVDLIFDTKIDTIPASTSFNTIDVLSRVTNIQSYNGAIWYYHQAQEAYPAVKFRYVIIPSGPMPGGIVPLNFDQQILEQEVQMGKNDAANIIKEGENGGDKLRKLYEEMRARIVIP